jgi:hypothetical protein
MDKPDVDWDIIKKTVATGTEKGPQQPAGDGWFTCEEYSEHANIDDTTARRRLKKCLTLGLMERQWAGRKYWYKVC